MKTQYIKHITAAIAYVFLGLTVASCNKEDLSPQAPQTERLAEDERFVQIDLSSVLGQSDDSFRFSYYDRDFYSSSGGPKLYPIMEEKNLNILVVARQQGGRTMYNELTFKKIPGERRVQYRGKIKVPNSNDNQVELAAIVLGEVGGRQFVTFNASTKRARVIPTRGVIKDDDTGTVSTTVPYLARWTPITIVPDQSLDQSLDTKVRLAQAATLHFKPSGCLLRFEIRYTKPPKIGLDGLPYSEAVTIEELEVRTNAFFLNWEYDFDTLGDAPSTRPNTLADGILVDNSTYNREFHFPVNRTIQANGTTTPGYFIWAMPRSQADKDAELRTDFIVHTTDGIGSTNREKRRISTKFLPRTGGSNNIELPVEYAKPVTD